MSDLEGRAFRREGNHLVPADLAAQEYLEGVKDGKEVLLTWRSPRSIINHRQMFAILHVCAEQLEAYPDVDSLLDAVKIATAWVRPVQKIDGEIIWLPKSINFSSMDETAFKRWKARALYVLGQMLGVDPIELLNETEIRNQRR